MKFLLKTASLLLATLCLNVYHSNCYAQRLPLRIYSVKEGLPQSQVQMILQDSTGYLWIGTADGLACFDGKSFAIYSRKEGLFSNYIQAGLLDANGDIWLSHRAYGLSKINPITRVVESVTLPAKIASSQINDIHQDISGVLWFATEGEGVFRFEGNRWQQLTVQNGLSSNFIYSICHTPDGTLWFGTDKGISIYPPADENKSDQIILSKRDGLPANQITSMLADRQGNIWVGTEKNGIGRIVIRSTYFKDWQFEKYSISDGLSSNRIQELYEDSKGKIWIATINNGVTIYTPPGLRAKNTEAFSILNNKHGLSYHNVTSVFQDREGSYWIGTNGGGLCQFWDKRFEFYGEEEGFVNDAIWAIREDSKGNIWFGSEKGLIRYRPKKDKSGNLDIKNYTRKQGLLGDEVDAIYQDEKRRLWLGVYGAGVQIFNPRTEKFSKSTIIDDEQILCIVPDKKGNLWFGSNGGGVYSYNLLTGKIKNFNTSNGLPSNDVFALLFSEQDILWIATREGGVVSYDGTNFMIYTAEHGFYSKAPLSLTKDLSGNIWISTAGDGIYKYDGKTFSNYFIKDGLSGDDAYFLVEDNSNNLWLGTRRGVEKFNPTSGVVKLYDRFEGFKAIETNQNAVFKDSGNMLWFGTIDGAIKYNPDEDLVNSVAPLIYIKDPVLLLGQTTIPKNDKIPFKNNHLSFYYSAVSFVCPEKILYKYKLDGLDSEWYEETDANYARYANLAPGTYTFKVMARNNDGIWSKKSAAYTFEILTPFYRSIWFLSGLVLLIGLAVYGAHWRHVSNIQKVNVRLEVRIRERTRQLVAEKEKVQQAYESLCESEERYRQLIELSPDAIVVHIDGIIEYVNKAGVILFGAGKADDLIGKSMFDLAHPDYLDIARERIRNIYEEKKRVRLMRQQMLRLDGTAIDVEVLGSPVTYIGKNAGQAVVRDITDRKKMEMELLKSQKLESIGLLAGGIAHDFNNILTAILGNISMAKLCYAQREVNSNLCKAEKAAVQAKELTQQLLTFSKGGAPIKETASIYDIVKESASFILSGSDIQCEFDSPADLWTVDVDPGQISQVIQNLIINAQQAMPQGKKIRLTLENLTIADDVFPSLSVGRYVKISIKDEGIGIPEKHLARIFDPYFTTKKKGSGLGLTTTYSIVKRHDGHISVSSTSGVGTVVDIYLPASSKIILKKEKREEFMHNGKGRILVMDDEDMVLELISQVLQHLGYTVNGVKDGESAIKEYRRALTENKPYDIIIMDLTIPGGIGGKEAIKSLKTIDPNIKAIVSSGYSNDPIMANHKKFGFAARLGKPYQIETLSATILELMNNKN